MPWVWRAFCSIETRSVRGPAAWPYFGMALAPMQGKDRRKGRECKRCDGPFGPLGSLSPWGPFPSPVVSFFLCVSSLLRVITGTGTGEPQGHAGARNPPSGSRHVLRVGRAPPRAGAARSAGHRRRGRSAGAGRGRLGELRGAGPWRAIGHGAAPSVAALPRGAVRAAHARRVFRGVGGHGRIVPRTRSRRQGGVGGRGVPGPDGDGAALRVGRGGGRGASRSNCATATSKP